MDNKTLTVTVRREARGSNPQEYTYTFEGDPPGLVDPVTGLIDLSGKGKNKLEIVFQIGEPFASHKPVVGFADPPVEFSVPAKLFTGISPGGGGKKQCKLTDNNDLEDQQGYKYTLNFDDKTRLDPRIVNRN